MRLWNRSPREAVMSCDVGDEAPTDPNSLVGWGPGQPELVGGKQPMEWIFKVPPN